MLNNCLLLPLTCLFFFFTCPSLIIASTFNNCGCDCLKDAKLYFELADKVYSNPTDKDLLKKYTDGNWEFIRKYDRSEYCQDLSLVKAAFTCSLTKEQCKYDGFYAALYKNKKTDTYAIAFRGTHFASIPDWITNIKNYFGLGGDNCVNTQYDRAYHITADLVGKYGPQNLVVVGHSLGGGLASYVALRYGLNAYVYNTARNSWLTASQSHKDAKILSYITYDKLTEIKDIVSSTTGFRTKKTTDYHIPVVVNNSATPQLEETASKIYKKLKHITLGLKLAEVLVGVKLHGRPNFEKYFQIHDCNQTKHNNCPNIKNDTPKPLATAIIFDHSGSMADEQKINYARKATLAFPQYMNQDDLLSVSIFSNDAITPVGLELQERTEISPALQSILPILVPDGATNIGAGLERGLEQLCTVPGEKLKKGALLLSDGMNNTGEYNTVVQQYKDYNIPIYTVKFGDEASEVSLRKIAEQTGGVFMDSNQQTVAGVYAGIYDAINGNSVVAAYHDYMRPTGRLAYQVDVTPGASSMNINTSWQGSKLKTIFTSPSGSTFSGDQLPHQADRFESGSITQFTQILNPEAGRWKLDISWEEPPSEAERVNLLVSEHTDVYTSILGFSPEYNVGDTVTINVQAAELDGGNNKIALSNAKVKAKVQIPGPEVIRMILAQSSKLRVYNDVRQDITREVELFDDGEHNDYNKGDGIFGGFFTETELNGSYIVTAHIEGSKSNGGYVNRHSTGSFQVGSLQDAEVTTSQIMQYSRALEDRMRNKVVNPLGGMQSSGASLDMSSGEAKFNLRKRKKRSRSLMDNLSN